MSTQEVLAEIRRIGPELAERADATEAAGRLSDEHVRLLREAGAIRLLQPKRWGGFEAEPDSLSLAAAEAAHYCSATGWIVGIIGVHAWELGLYDERAQEEVWGDDQDTWIASTYMPTGKMTPVDGGFRFSGRWKFSSGCDLGSWIILGGLLMVDEAPPVYYHLLLPRADYQIVEGTWDVVGLRGTGSKDIVVEDVFVPAYRAMADRAIVSGTAPGCASASGLYRMPWSAMFPNAITAPLVGMAEAALAAATTYQRERMSLATGGLVSQAKYTMTEFGRAAADIDACRAVMIGNLREMWELVRNGEEVSLEMRSRGRAGQVQNGWRAARAVDVLFDQCGGGSLYFGTPLQRIWRDVHAAVHHVINVPDRALPNYSSVLMGLGARDAYV